MVLTITGLVYLMLTKKSTTFLIHTFFITKKPITFFNKLKPNVFSIHVLYKQY